MQFLKSLPAWLLLLTSLVRGQNIQESDVLVITNVDVIDTRQGLTAPNLTVVIKHGRIESIAKHAMIASSHKTKVVNGSGKYLIPGLWDMHAHSAGGPAAPWDAKIILPLYIANGITGIRDMGGNLQILKQRRESIESGELPGPHMFISGPFLNGGKPYEYSITTNTPEEGRKAVDKLAGEHVDFIKVLSELSRDTYFAVAEESRKQKLTFAGHVPESISASEASAAGQRSIEHLSGLTIACSREESELRKQRMEAAAKHDNKAYHAAGMRSLDTYDPEKARALFAEFKKNSTWQVPTLSWWDAQPQLASASLSNPLLKYVPASVRKTEDWNPDHIRQSTPPAMFEDLEKAVSRYRELTHALQEAGVPLLAGTDSPDPYVLPGFSLHDELALLVHSGLTPAQALRTATYNPALFLGKSAYGTAERGSVADLVLLDANPLIDIRNTRKISAVIVGGKLFSRKDLDQMLEQVEAEAARH
jgi:imidazolonepropionase-like amidohydrolase